MPALDIGEIRRILPHRYPMLLVDRVLECDDETRIVGLKNVTANEEFFQGHFPEAPVMPGVYQLEAMAQTGGILLIRRMSRAAGTPYFMAIDKARFRRVIQPGDQLRIEVDIVSVRSKVAKFNGKILVDGKVASEAELMCMITPSESE